MSRMATSTRSGAGGGTEPLTRRCSKKVISEQDLFSRFGLPDDQVHHVAQVLSLFERRQLPVGAGTMADDLARVVHGVARLELVDHVVHELEQLVEQLVERNF